MMFILLAKYPVVALFLGVALGMQHFEQAIFAFGAVLFALLYSHYLKTPATFSLRWSICAFAGALIGKLVLVVLFWHLHIVITDRRYYFLQNYQMFLQMFYYHIQYLLWSFFGAGWFAVAKFAERGKAARPFFIAVVGLILLQLTVSDETRVFWIVVFRFWRFTCCSMKASCNSLAVMLLPGYSPFGCSRLFHTHGEGDR